MASIAHLHFRRTRYKAGTRHAGERIAYITGQSHAQEQYAYSHAGGREDIVCVAAGNLPSWSGTSLAFFEAAEQYERGGGNGPKNARNTYAGVAFEEWKLTLPVELTTEQNRVLATDLMTVIAGNRLPYSYALHNPKTLDGTQDQPHLHVLISARITDDHVRTAAQHFQRWNSHDPARGGAQKDPRMNVYHATKLHRLMISDVVNVHLEYHGTRARVHPESLKSRGIERGPEPKLLPSDSAKYRKTQALSKTMLEVFRMRTARLETRGTEDMNARQYWQQRKASLGITGEMSREERIMRLVTLRHERHELRGETSQRHTHGQAQAVGSRLTRLTHLVSQRGMRGLGQAQEEIGPRGPALRVHLHEEARGLSY